MVYHIHVLFYLFFSFLMLSSHSIFSFYNYKSFIIVYGNNISTSII